MKTKILTVLIFILLLASCSSDDETPEVMPTLAKEQLLGHWKITYFENQIDKTSNYEGLYFLFNEGGEFFVLDAKFDGIYNIFEDKIANQTTTIVNIDFKPKADSDAYEDRFKDLIEQWIVKKISNNATKIELEERMSTNKPEKLHLEKVEISS